MKNKVATYIEQKVPEFHQRRLDSLTGLNLDKVLMRKNAYLFKAKNINTAGGLVKAILDAHLSSQEETVFGAFLENVAIHACSIALGGITHKSEIKSTILELNAIAQTPIAHEKRWANS